MDAMEKRSQGRSTGQAHKRHGLDLLNAGIGFSTSASGFMAPVAARVREEAGIPVATAWGMDEPATATAAHRIDFAMIARASRRSALSVECGT
ncbi:hypothetical protein QCE47_18775 [Caballeronia sp. LZ025]|uniref:hypothetical protein n=1 Tax=Caballeronia TaxID=1827195 RepID=UPI001FD4751B|nr:MULTISPECIES: hypothetical protein [Caballeronia]MDR5734353.1 hypothetical protein [Caballeronia sp. LZ025]